MISFISSFHITLSEKPCGFSLVPEVSLEQNFSTVDEFIFIHSCSQFFHLKLFAGVFLISR